MNTYSIPPLVSSLLFLVIGLLVLIKSRRHPAVSYSFFLTTLVTFWWQFSWFILFNIQNEDLAAKLVKLGYSGITFIPVTFFHFYSKFLEKNENNKLIVLYYSIAFLFLILLWASDTYIKGFYVYYWGYYPKAGVLHPVFLLFLTIVAAHSFYLLITEGYKIKWKGIKSYQIKYLLCSFFVYCLASFDFAVNYGIEFYPLGFIAILFCLAIVAHATSKYQLLEISLAITRGGVFLSVYTLVLGLPIWIGFKLMGVGQWLIPVFFMAIFATIGPFIYLFIQKKTEDKLLQEQRQYQSTLRKASLGMGQIKNLKRLLNLIAHIVTKAVRISHCAVFLFHEPSQQYVLKASKGTSESARQHNVLGVESALIRYLYKHKEPILFEEVKQRVQNYKDRNLAVLEKTMHNIEAELIVPSFIEQRLIALIVLGKKRSGKLYSQDDLVVFSILASQAALAIENAMFYEETKRTHEQLFKAEKMATIGTMADGLSHQINNRLHAMGFIAGDAMDTLKRSKEKKVSKETRKLLDDIENALKRIEDNVKRGGEIVQGLLTYTRKGEEGFTPVEFNKLLDASIEMASFKIKTREITFKRNIDKTAPRIKGNFTQLQEVFFNIIDNAYDAITQRKEELKEQGFKGFIDITAHMNGLNRLEIIVKDNGIGVKDANKDKIFAPFFTTKLSSKKGTGLGMYVIKQIIEENHRGKVEFSSRYKEGSQTKILLPIYQPDLNKS